MHTNSSLITNYQLFPQIIDDDDAESYKEKFSVILSYFIDSEVKRLKINAKDSSKINPEKLFVDNLIVKCRIYNANAGDMMIVRALGKFFARVEFQHVFVDEMTKMTFSRLFKWVTIHCNTFNYLILPMIILVKGLRRIVEPVYC